MEMKTACSVAPDPCLRAGNELETTASAAATVSKRADSTIPSDAFNLVSEYLPFYDTVKAMKSAPSIFVPTSELERSLVLYLAIQYLPLRDLSAVALVSKSTRSSITTEAVVRAAYLQTGNRFSSRKSMDELSILMHNKSIHIPSPLRLLRIATGNKCEFCLQSSYKTMKSWSYGVFACWNCIKKSRYSSLPKSLSRPWNTSSVKYSKSSSLYDAVFSHPRNAVSEKFGSKYYVWAERRAVAGESVSPIIAWDDIDGIASYTRTKSNCRTMVDWSHVIDNYIDVVIKAPAVEKYNEFNVAYQTVKQELTDQTERANREKMERSRLREEKTKTRGRATS